MRLLAIAAAGAAAATLAACADMGMGQSSDAGAISAAGAGAPAAATSPAAMPTTAMGYVTEAGRSDMFEIQSSQLAASRSASAQVKDFAATMIRDHTNSTQLVKAAATQAGMTPAAPSLDSRRQAMLDALSGAAGADFDRLYLHQQLMAHQEALALHQGYAQNGDQSALRTVAGQIAPVVNQHLTMLQGLGAA